jgi:NhaC family Na+:H+ antiporter
MKEARLPTMLESLLPLFILFVVALVSQFVWKAGMFVPLIIAIAVGSFIAYRLGHKWNAQQQFIVDGVSKAIPVVLILFIIGSIVGTWVLSGTIPLLIHYGLVLISPAWFIPAAALATGILAVAIGSSFTAIATIGVALMAVGSTMGFPPGLIVGAIISGAFMGDKLSPLSDTTNMTPAMTDTDLFSHVRHMTWDTIPAFAISLILFWFVGMQYAPAQASTTEVAALIATLKDQFNLNIFLLILPIVTIYALYKKWPALPTLLLLSVLGGIAAMIFQGSSLTQVIQAMTNGYSGETGVASVDKLLNKGGITSMLTTASVIITATALGGLLAGTQMFTTIINSLIAKVRSDGSLMLSSLLTTLGIAFASGTQTLPIVLSGQGFKEAYKARGLDTKNLSRNIEATGTVGCSLVPWGAPAMFTMGVLGVNPSAFIPFAFFAMLVPIINAIYGYTGWTIAKKDYSVSIDPTNPPNQSTSSGASA